MISLKKIKTYADAVAREFTPEKISKRISMGDSFMKNIITRGRLLYESPAILK